MAMQPLGRRAKVIFGGFLCLAGLAFVVMSLIWGEGNSRYSLILLGVFLALTGVINLLSARKPSEVFPEERPKESGSTYQQLSQKVPTSKLSLLTFLAMIIAAVGPFGYSAWKSWLTDSGVRPTSPRKVPRPEDVPQLIGRLSDTFARGEALTALAELGPAARDAVPEVVRVLDDMNAPLEQPMAARTLGRIGAGHPATVPALCRALTNWNPDVRIMALYAVADLGPEAEKAIPTLEKVKQQDRDPSIREAAGKLIATIIEEKKHVRDRQ